MLVLDWHGVYQSLRHNICVVQCIEDTNPSLFFSIFFFFSNHGDAIVLGSVTAGEFKRTLFLWNSHFNNLFSGQIFVGHKKKQNPLIESYILFTYFCLKLKKKKITSRRNHCGCYIESFLRYEIEKNNKGWCIPTRIIVLWFRMRNKRNRFKTTELTDPHEYAIKRYLISTKFIHKICQWIVQSWTCLSVSCAFLIVFYLHLHIYELGLLIKMIETRL